MLVVTDDTREDRKRHLIEALEHDDVVIERALERVSHELPSYRAVPRESIVASGRRTLALTAQTLQGQQVPRGRDIWWDEDTTSVRLAVGVPTEDMTAAFWVLISCLRERIVELATEYGVEDADIVAMTTLLAKLGDEFAVQGRAIHERHKRALSEADRRRRDEWLVALLSGMLTVGEVEQGVTRYRLHREIRYRAFCTGHLGSRSITRAERALTDQFPGEGHVVTLADDGRLVGLVDDELAPVPNVLLAVGPPAVLGRVSASYDVARDVLTTASRRAADGVHTVESLGWRLAVPVAGPVHDLLRARYLDPLRERGVFGQDVVDALRAYLTHGRSIPRTAGALNVHVNTLRYRLARFEEFTRSSLSDTDTIVELALVLDSETTDVS